jgi:nicotinamide mononucleotide transporter PnuC
MTANKEREFNLAFNIFLVCGMLVALAITTIFKLRQPGVNTFMLLLACLGSLMGVINTVMSANGNILSFVFGFIDVLIGTIVYYDNGIMGTFALHAFYFLPMQFIGFWQWRKRGARIVGPKESGSSDGGAKVRARRLGGRQLAFLSSGIIFSTIVLFFLLVLVDRAKVDAGLLDEVNHGKILLDALVMMLNIGGQILLSFAFTEQWYLWILVNISSISLWTVAMLGGAGSGNAAVMLIKYIFYLLNSLNGLRIWLRLSRESAEEVAKDAF